MDRLIYMIFVDIYEPLRYRKHKSLECVISEPRKLFISEAMVRLNDSVTGIPLTL